MISANCGLVPNVASPLGLGERPCYRPERRGINLSLGGSVGSTTLKNAVDYAWNKGVVLACAAGNNGTKAKSYPAAYTNCIAVAATDQNDAKASFSQYGSSWVDVAAPGVAILSTMPDTTVYLNTAYGCNYLPPASLRAAEGGEAISRPVGRLLRRLLPPRNDSG